MTLQRGSIRVWAMSAAVLFGAAVLSAEPTKSSSTGGTASNTTAKPATDVKSKPRKPGQTEALKKAIDELNKEFKDYTAKPETATLRTSSDYFKELPAETTVEDILSVLNGNLSGPPSQVAYVKWQLLSACPAKFDAEQSRQAYRALQNAPQPFGAVASSPQVKQQLDRAIQGKKQADVDNQIVEGFKKEQQKVDDLNAPIIGYRKGLIQRLPSSLEAYEASLQELVIRLDAGIEGGALANATKALTSDIRTWATIDAKPDEVASLSVLVRKLKTFKAPVAYAPTIREEKGVAKWGAYASEFGKTLDDLEAVLKENAGGGGGGGGLKFRDDGSKDKKKK